MTFVPAETIDEALAVSMPDEFHKHRGEFSINPAVSGSTSKQEIAAVQA